ncbi:hypothetical protein P3T43_005437 [Paraburkholderia sp. GAS41]|jgi:hypothetical protein|uniref:hypothetical protein n=1 Tax=Paraburkholderia sp. GAS41 TaxID=3035134 RepID=UPI003D23B2BF
MLLMLCLRLRVVIVIGARVAMLERRRVTRVASPVAQYMLLNIILIEAAYDGQTAFHTIGCADSIGNMRWECIRCRPGAGFFFIQNRHAACGWFVFARRNIDQRAVARYAGKSSRQRSKGNRNTAWNLALNAV